MSVGHRGDWTIPDDIIGLAGKTGKIVFDDLVGLVIRGVGIDSLVGVLSKDID